MNEHVKTAIQRIDADIAAATELRRQLLELGSGPAPGTASEPEPGAPSLDAAARRFAKITKRGGYRGKAGGVVVKRGPHKKRKVTDGAGSANKPLAPLSPDMIAAGRVSPDPITTESLMSTTGCDRKSASNAFIRWMKKGWVRNAGRGQYARTTTFGVDTALQPETRFGKGTALPPASVKTPAERSAAPAPAPPVPSEEKLTPYSARGVELGKQLKREFTGDELGALLPNGKPAAYYWAAQWRNKNWIEKLDFDRWRKTEGFGT